MEKVILVTGAGGSAGNNFIQSIRLADKQIKIIGTDSSKYYAKLSNADETYLVPNITSDDYLPAMKAIIKRTSAEFLHCQPDPEVKYISDHRKELNIKTLLPSEVAIDIAQDKAEFADMLLYNNVPCPMTDLVENKDRLKKLVNGEKKWLRASRGAGSLAALPVKDYFSAYYWIEYWRTKGLDWSDFIISDFLPGKEYAFQSLWYDGELVTSAARQRIEYLFQARMPSGQSSTPTIAKSVHNVLVNSVATQAIKLLDSKPNGVYCVDLKEDKNGIPNVTEINAGRFFTTSLFFSAAGSNMPYYYVCLALGKRLPPLLQYNAVEENLFWIRQIDCGYKLVREDDFACVCNYTN